MSPSQIHRSGLHSRIGFQSGCGLYSRLQEPNAIRSTGGPASSANAFVAAKANATRTRSDLALLNSSRFGATATLAVGPGGILPADKCAKATGKMPVFPTAKMAVPHRLAGFSTKLSHLIS